MYISPEDLGLQDEMGSIIPVGRSIPVSEYLKMSFPKKAGIFAANAAWTILAVYGGWTVLKKIIGRK